jgi:Protein of unknown function (DUF3261)
VQRLIAPLVLASALAGCATAPPVSHASPQLRLAPALLGRTLNLQQHLTLQAPGRDQQLDVLLEADARHVQMGMVAMGQVAARLDWDGTTLAEDKAPWWPSEVAGSRILSDLQLTLWPVAAIRAALPAGWTLVEDGDVRTLAQDGDVVTVITRRCAPAPSSCAKSQDPQRAETLIELDQRREHFKLKIESRDLGAGAS